MIEISYDEIKTSKCLELLKSKKSFRVVGLNGRMKSAIYQVESEIESLGMTCRVYTLGRIASAGGSLFGGVTGLIGVASAIGIAAHNIATYDPDYEIGKHLIDNYLDVNFKKD